MLDLHFYEKSQNFCLQKLMKLSFNLVKTSNLSIL